MEYKLKNCETSVTPETYCSSTIPQLKKTTNKLPGILYSTGNTANIL